MNINHLLKFYQLSNRKLFVVFSRRTLPFFSRILILLNFDGKVANNCPLRNLSKPGQAGCLRIIIILLKMASYDTDTSSFLYKFSILILKNLKKLNITWLRWTYNLATPNCCYFNCFIRSVNNLLNRFH